MENFSIPFGKPHFNTDILKRKQEVSGSGLINTGVFVDVDNVENVKKIVKGAEISSFFEKKYPQPERKVFHVLAVDNVDNPVNNSVSTYSFAQFSTVFMVIFFMKTSF